MADVWYCGVTLYIMLVGACPFQDKDHKNFRKTIQSIMSVQYKIPDDVDISQDCKHLNIHVCIFFSTLVLRKDVYKHMFVFFKVHDKIFLFFIFFGTNTFICV